MSAPDSPASNSRYPLLPYNPALDGIRGVAVVAVVLYHAGALSGGWLGVEVFFVLSGYLITSLLVVERERDGSVHLGHFWLRRARRLLPGIGLLVLIVGAYAWWFQDDRPSSTIDRDVFGLLTYTSNWTTLAGDGYWQQFAWPSPLRHAWSLAVEEQFYLVFPLIAVVVLRAGVRRWAIPGLAVGALAWQVVAATVFSADRVYLGTDTRAFGLLAGATVAVVVVDHGAPGHGWRRVSQPAGVVGLATLAVGSVMMSDATTATFRGPFQLMVLASIALLVSEVDPAHLSALGRLLSRRSIVMVGRWSYGIYLFHWPLLIAIEPDDPSRPWLLAAVVLAVSVPFAALTYRVVERPIRMHGFGVFGSMVPVWSGVAAVGVVAVVAAPPALDAPPTVEEVATREIEVNEPVSETTLAATPPPVAETNAPAETAPPSSPPAAGAVLPSAPSVATTTTSTVPAPLRAGRPDDRPVRVYLVGDSLGVSVDRSLQPISGELDIEVFSRAAGACGYDRVRMQYFNEDYQPEECTDIVAAWRDDVLAYQPDAVVFSYAGWWGWYHDGAVRTQCEPELAEHVRRLYDLAADDLAASGAPVFFLAPADWEGDQLGPEGIPRYFDCLRALMHDWSDGRGDVAVVDVAAMLCDDAGCDSTVAGVPTRPDGVHFSGESAPAVMVALLDEMMDPPAGGWPDYGSIDP